MRPLECREAENRANPGGPNGRCRGEAGRPGADQIEGGDINEKEPAPKRAWNYSDSGYESGRSGFRRREDGEKSYLGAK